MSNVAALQSAWETFKLGSLWQSYAKANAGDATHPGEAKIVDDYVTTVASGGSSTTTPPVVSTATGKGLIGIVAAGFFTATPPSPPASKYTVKNATPDRAFDAKNTSLDELANVVAAVIVDASL